MSSNFSSCITVFSFMSNPSGEIFFKSNPTIFYQDKNYFSYLSFHRNIIVWPTGHTSGDIP
nr:MAG TPA: hypothetical protein [Caudoviricetes sp.]